ncbi:MAG: hypothetical protein J6P07_01330 [Spirochaetaceae bacterium]|nr:hypothetical protein [Spirochaetaceae bacterium]MBO7731878.1 hypothetical protein [Methanobrevibacter sp.]
MELTEKIEIDGKTYYGRHIKFFSSFYKKEVEELVYEHPLFPVLEDKMNFGSDEEKENANQIYDSIFVFVPKDVLVKEDTAVTDWIKQNICPSI